MPERRPAEAEVHGAEGRGVARTGGSTPHYVQWGVVSITVSNLVVLGLMILVFAAAVALRLPEHRDADSPRTARDHE